MSNDTVHRLEMRDGCVWCTTCGDYAIDCLVETVHEAARQYLTLCVAVGERRAIYVKPNGEDE